jgi:molybdopterin converting factor small subunit
MKVQVYAILKDHFDAVFDINGGIHSVAELKQRLIQMKPAAKGILQSCRFAVNDTFISNDFKFSEHDRVAIIPPASGG